jgi:hypothetical protein
MISVSWAAVTPSACFGMSGRRRSSGSSDNTKGPHER